MARVNPPPNLRTPKALLKDRDSRSYFEQLEFILFQMWGRTGGQEDSILDVTIEASTSEAKIGAIDARFDELNQRVGSGVFLTGDETGFTGDTTKIYGDRAEI